MGMEMNKKTTIFLLISMMIIFIKCQEMPSKPEFQNPLDPGTFSEKGDPFNLSVAMVNNYAELQWSSIDNESVVGYKIYRRRDDDDSFTNIHVLNSLDTTFVDSTLEAGYRFWYFVTAFDNSGRESTKTEVKAIAFDSSPIIFINNDEKYTSTRDVALTILSSNCTEMKISNTPEFSDAVWENFSTSKGWRLSDNEGEKSVYVKLRDVDGQIIGTVHDEIYLDQTNPTARFSMDPQTGYVRDGISLDASASSDNMCDKSELKIRWDWQNDGEYDTGWNFDKDTLIIFEREGVYTIKLLVQDGAGLQDSIAKELNISVPVMIYIEAGTFTMGSKAGLGDSDEHPEHSVYLDGYWIDTYEVTNEEYSKFLNAGNAEHYNNGMEIVNSNGIYSPVDNFQHHPVVSVTYRAAKAYASWAGKSLPTEAQWERAARGDGQELYPWGEKLEPNQANYWNSGDPYELGGVDYTTPVGFYNGLNRDGYITRDNSNEYGLYDMAGNVWEWCLDWYDADYYSIGSYSNPAGPATGTHRVIRGGSWADDPYYLRATSRSYRDPDVMRSNIGFRCVINDF